MLATQTKSVGSFLTAESPQRRFDWKQIVEGVEPFLTAVSRSMGEQVNQFEPQIAAYAHYALTAQGKQLRPSLVALSADASGGQNQEHVTAAVIIEMVHLATLVHDDVIDEAEIRRARPTLAANWGNEISVLLGDCLFAQALKLAADFPTTEICRAVASATKTVCSGEILQNQQQGNFQITRPEYFRILAMKTAELFALSCDLGAFIANTSPAKREALRQYGLALGIAYQIYDDCLDIYASEFTTGKSVGSDLAKGKLTLPVLIVLERADAYDRAQLEELITNRPSDYFPRVLEILQKYNALQESRRTIFEYLETARQNLRLLPKSDGVDGLHGMCEYLSQQAAALDVKTEFH